jgi:hypothetical protein
MGYQYHIRIDVKKPTEEDFIQLPNCSKRREAEDLCSKLEQFVLASLRGEARKLVE